MQEANPDAPDDRMQSSATGRTKRCTTCFSPSWRWQDITKALLMILKVTRLVTILTCTFQDPNLVASEAANPLGTETFTWRSSDARNSTFWFVDFDLCIFRVAIVILPCCCFRYTGISITQGRTLQSHWSLLAHGVFRHAKTDSRILMSNVDHTKVYFEAQISKLSPCVAKNPACRKSPIRGRTSPAFCSILRCHWSFSTHRVSCHEGADLTTVLQLLVSVSTVAVDLVAVKLL